MRFFRKEEGEKPFPKIRLRREKISFQGKEVEAGILPSEKGKTVTRRGLISAMIGALGLLMVDEAIRKFRIEQLEKLFPERKNKLFPGFIESGVKVPFITLKEGHKAWVTAVVEDPVVNRVGKVIINDMDNAPERYDTVGKALENLRAVSGSILRSRYPDAPSQLEKEEAIHTAVVTAAAVYNNYINYKRFGLDPARWGKPKNVDDQRWGSKGIARKSYPPLFPGKRSIIGVESSGKDRAMHFFNHMFIAYELLYSRKHKTAEHLEAPALMSLLIGSGLDVAQFETVELVSQLMGGVYEIKGLSDLKNIPLFSKEPERICEGPFDPEVRHDLRANQLGFLCGIAVFNGHFDEVVEILNDSRLLVKTDNPQIPDDLLERFERFI